MGSFKDNEGRSWVIDVNGTSFRDVKNRLGVNLMEVLDFETEEDKKKREKEGGKPPPQLLDRLMDDPELLVNILYVLCIDQCQERGLDPEGRDFGKALGGNCLEQATEVFLRALGDFFPPRKRRIFIPLMEKGMRIQEGISKKIAKMIEGPEIDAEISKTLKMPTNLSSSSEVSQV